MNYGCNYSKYIGMGIDMKKKTAKYKTYNHEFCLTSICHAFPKTFYIILYNYQINSDISIFVYTYRQENKANTRKWVMLPMSQLNENIKLCSLKFQAVSTMLHCFLMVDDVLLNDTLYRFLSPLLF